MTGDPPVRDDLELVVDDLSFPTSMTFDGAGGVYVASRGCPSAARVREDASGRSTRTGYGGCSRRTSCRRSTGSHGPDGGLLVSEGGHPQQISRIGADASRSTVLEPPMSSPR